MFSQPNMTDPHTQSHFSVNAGQGAPIHRPMPSNSKIAMPTPVNAGMKPAMPWIPVN